MRCFFLIYILLLSSCSLNKESSYWTKDPIKQSLKNDKLLIIKNKSNDFKKMSYDEFDIFLKDYSKKNGYRDINK
jgi:hypothetical protein|tara:strand:- start:227 stop:451 length:225 start_codon:yes stop_codon:yes gene_type:complete